MTPPTSPTISPRWRLNTKATRLMGHALGESRRPGQAQEILLAYSTRLAVAIVAARGAEAGDDPVADAILE